MAPKRRNYTEDEVLAAITDIKENHLTFTQASKKHNIPRSTLQDKINLRYNPLKVKPGPDTILRPHEEARLVQYLKGMTAKGHAISVEGLRKDVKKLMDNIDGNHERSDKYFKDNMPSRGWVQRFRNRFKDTISVRTPEHLGIQRANVKENSIRQWFKDLSSFLLEEHQIVAEEFFKAENGSRIFNFDEIGFPLYDPGRRKVKLLTAKGSKNVYSVGADTRKQITVLGMCSADGSFNKPMVLHLGRRVPYKFTDETKDKYAVGRSECGWTTTEVFFEYVANIFYNEIKHAVQFPIILFFDRHSSHMNLPLSEFCRSHNIISYCFPPYASHIIQPFEVAVYGPLKKYYAESLSTASGEQNGPVTRAQFIEVFDVAWCKAKSKHELVQKGFKKCGLVPFNPDALDYQKLMGEKHKLNQQRKPNIIKNTGVNRCIEAFETLLPQEHLQTSKDASENKLITLNNVENMQNQDAQFAFRVYKSFHDINEGIAIEPPTLEEQAPNESDDNILNPSETEYDLEFHSDTEGSLPNPDEQETAHQIPDEFDAIVPQTSQEEGSTSHLKSLNICKFKGSLAKPKSLSSAGLHKEGVISVIQNVYWLVKENIEIHKYASLHNHVNTILKQYGKGIESSYATDTCVWKIVDAISEVLELKIISKIKEAKYFSLCADESANIATSKSMVIYCRFAELPQYEVATYFFKLLEIKDGAAHSVYDEIINYLNKCKIDLKSFVGWASDGSSVMMGHRNGVKNKLKEVSPCLVSIHNPGHGENLAIVDSYESVMYLKYTVDETLRDIYTYFCRSPNREEELKMLQDILEEPQLQMRKLYDIKWLARSDYMNAVRKLLKSLMECFREDTTDPLALGIYKQLTSYKFLLVFHAMCDIINNLAVLSKFLQKSDLHPYDIFPVVNSTINNIENNFASEECNSLLGGIHVSALHKYFMDSDYPLHFNQCMINYINFGEGDENQAISIIKTFSKNLVNNLKLRFYDIKNFDNWKIFDPKQIPSDQQILVQHGMEELKQLCNFYCHPETGVFDWKFDDVQGEYQIFKEFVQNEAKNLHLIKLCKLIILHYSKAFPLITQLMKLCLALPVGSTDYKRGFSQRNPIKTTSVIGLEKEHLDALSRIRLNGPPLEKFDFEEAAVMLQKKMDPAKESEEVFDNTPHGIFKMSTMPPPDRNDTQKKKILQKKSPNQRRPSSCSDSSSSSTDEDSSDDCIRSSKNESQRKLTKQLKAKFKKSKYSQMKMKNLIRQQEKIISQQQQILSCQSVHEEEIKELKFGNKRAIPSEQSFSAEFANKELTRTNTISENENLIFKVASLIRTILQNENPSSTTIEQCLNIGLIGEQVQKKQKKWQ